MKNRAGITRRSILKTGAGVAAGAFAASAVAGALQATPANPEGPFYPVHQQADMDADLTLVQGHTERAAGEAIEVSGRVLDEDGKPIADAVVDVWQANAHGRYHHEGDTSEHPLDPNFQGWAIMKTDAEGRYRFKTVKPGAYTAMGDWWRPPHIHYKVSRRGYRDLTTQMYWAGDLLNDKDLLLQEVPEAERARLLVSFDISGDLPQGVFDVVLSKVTGA
jgi:protocatechuate 3,4-dioxygenase beta subunit